MIIMMRGDAHTAGFVLAVFALRVDGIAVGVNIGRGVQLALGGDAEIGNV